MPRKPLVQEHREGLGPFAKRMDRRQKRQERATRAGDIAVTRVTVQGGGAGETGPAGPAGADGASIVGPPGFDGTDGFDSFPIPGAAGVPGAAGPTIPGFDGTDGLDASPIPGPPGNCVVGPMGPPGLDGADGLDGIVGLGSGSLAGLVGDLRRFVIHINGGGAEIADGIAIEIPDMPGCTVEGWTLVGSPSGSLVLDLWSDSYANHPPTVADTMIATGTKPTLSSAVKNQDLTVDWADITIAAGATLTVNVDSCTTCEFATLTLRLRMT